MRLRQRPTDADAAMMLADALMRQARVTGNAGLARGAEQALVRVLRDEPLDYGARRMLATVYLSEHRFRDAIREAERLRDERPRDDWNYGVIGDGHLELGEHDAAFAAFQRMIDLRPTAGAYARAAYALELRGRLDAALEAMRLSTDATAPNDPESIAWHHAQMGDLHRNMGRLKDAAFEYAWADHSFPGHPFARIGMARIKEADGDLRGAAAAYEQLMSTAPTPDVAEKLGDLYTALDRPIDAARQYALAEAGWRDDAPQPALLARFLAEHGRSLDEAVRLAEGAAADRHDIVTEDALAWCYFKAGRLTDAAAAIEKARRTGTHDRSILFHAAAIAQALGDADGGRQLARLALEGNPRFDTRLAPAARRLLEPPVNVHRGGRPEHKPLGESTASLLH
jgi:tetratricopeptide (TPR) repeat protein